MIEFFSNHPFTVMAMFILLAPYITLFYRADSIYEAYEEITPQELMETSMFFWGIPFVNTALLLVVLNIAEALLFGVFMADLLALISMVLSLISNFLISIEKFDEEHTRPIREMHLFEVDAWDEIMGNYKPWECHQGAVISTITTGLALALTVGKKLAILAILCGHKQNMHKQEVTS